MSQAAPSKTNIDLAQTARRNSRLAIICGLVFVTMVGAAFASVPLYKAFCQLTGFGGTVRKAEAAPDKVLAEPITIRFDSNVRGLPWTFKAEQVSQTLKIGATGLAFFKVTNTGATATTGRAAYNVVPDQAGAYFQKLECFCFTSQTLQPGQTVEFPVVYFVDPKLATDEETKGIKEITLSYTFFPDAKPSGNGVGGQVAPANSLKALGDKPSAGL